MNASAVARRRTPDSEPVVSRSPGLSAVTKLSDEVGGRKDGQFVTEAKEMLVALDQERSLADGERQEIVVIGIR